MNLLDLPDCMIEQIFEYLSYDEIARKRLVCKRVDKICQHLLNIGFSKMIRRHNKDLKRIKSLLPRRESERRNHPLSRHADVLTSIETRISMLSMTYTKYMELNLCCFIPGKVIDEVFRILHLIETTTKPLRPHEVLQELRDISSMAIEHFDDKIAHLLKKYFIDMNSQKYPAGISSEQSSFDDSIMGGISNLVGGHYSQHNRNDGIITKTTVTPVVKCPEARNNRIMIQKLQQKYNTAVKKFNRMIQIQNKQSRQLRENAVLVSEMNSQIIELKRRVEEADTKNREIMANLTQMTGEPNPGGGGGGIGGGSSSCSTSTNVNCPSTEKATRNIRPRAATIILKRRITESSSSSSSSITASASASNEVSDDVMEGISKKPKLEL